MCGADYSGSVLEGLFQDLVVKGPVVVVVHEGDH